MSGINKVAKSASVIIILGMIGKLLGFAREILITAKFGSGVETDTFIMAMSAITLFTGLFTRSINTTTIPILSEIEKKDGKAKKINHTNNFLNIISLISVLIIIASFFLAPYLIKILAPGFVDEKQFNLAVLLMRIGLPVILLSSIIGIFSSYLHTEGRFSEAAAGTSVYNVIYILFLIVFSSVFKIKGLMIAVVVATIGQLFLLILGVYKIDYKYKFLIDFKDEHIKKTMYLIPPIILSTSISDINAVIDKAMASSLVDGSISALNYAEKLNALVVGIFISAITTVLFPILAKEATKEDKTDLKNTLNSGINIIFLITIPAAIAMMVLSNPIVKAVYQRGKFDALATTMTAGALIFSSLKMVSASVGTISNNTLYSLHDTKTPLFIAAFAVIINVSFNFLLIGPMAHRGLALATTISSYLACFIRLYVLRRKLGPLGYGKVVKTGLKILFASLVMGGAVYFIYEYLSGVINTGRLMELLVLAVSMGIGIIIYLLLIYLLKVEELTWIVKLLKSKLRGSEQA